MYPKRYNREGLTIETHRVASKSDSPRVTVLCRATKHVPQLSLSLSSSLSRKRFDRRVASRRKSELQSSLGLGVRVAAGGTGLMFESIHIALLRVERVCCAARFDWPSISSMEK